MMSSARASTEGGIVKPRALAVLRLTTSSNRVASSTGRSAGFAPWRILATWHATAVACGDEHQGNITLILFVTFVAPQSLAASVALAWVSLTPVDPVRIAWSSCTVTVTPRGSFALAAPGGGGGGVRVTSWSRVRGLAATQR